MRIGEIVKLIPVGDSVASGAAGISFLETFRVLSDVVPDPRNVALAMASAVVAGGSIIVPRLIDWYRAKRKADREEHVLDLESDSAIFSAEVRKRVEAEASKEEAFRKLEEVSRKVDGLSSEIAGFRLLLNSRPCLDPGGPGHDPHCDPSGAP